MFVARDVLHAGASEVIDSGPQSDSIGDVARARLKALWGWLVDGLFEGYVLDHVAAALPWLHVLQ